MMQEKKKLDDMAEKYKEEMMRIYNKKRASEQSETKAETEPETKPDSPPHNSEPVQEEKCGPAADPEKDECGKNEQVHGHKSLRDDKKLMHPPMPEIPYKRENKLSGGIDSQAGENSSKPCDDSEKSCSSESSKTKFPPAKELISMDCIESAGEDSEPDNEESSVPAAAMQRHERSRIPDARFESDGNRPEEPDSSGHMQGNYNFPTEPDGQDEEYDSDDFEPGRHGRRRIPRQTGGHGYFQAEVTEQGSGSPIAGAAVVVVRKLGDYDSLEMILTTDSGGMTESAVLDVPDVPAHNNGDPDLCGEYMITVYKEGFCTVNMLPVPIFDTIKSIQPVEMLKAEDNCRKR